MVHAYSYQYITESIKTLTQVVKPQQTNMSTYSNNVKNNNNLNLSMHADGMIQLK